MAVGNSINEGTTGICGFTSTAFVGSPATQHCVQIGGATTSTLVSVTNGTTGQFLGANTGAAPTWQTPGGGTFVKQVRASTAATTALSAFPFSDSQPTNSDGTEVLTVAITPSNSANILVIEGQLCVGVTNVGTSILPAAALGIFQDSTSGALFATFTQSPDSPVSAISYQQATFLMPFKYYMTAGTTSATTFKIRAGYNSSFVTNAKINWNYVTNDRNYGGYNLCTLFVSEYTA